MDLKLNMIRLFEKVAYNIFQIIKGGPKEEKVILERNISGNFLWNLFLGIKSSIISVHRYNDAFVECVLQVSLWSMGQGSSYKRETNPKRIPKYDGLFDKIWWHRWFFNERWDWQCWWRKLKAVKHNLIVCDLFLPNDKKSTQINLSC